MDISGYASLISRQTRAQGAPLSLTPRLPAEDKNAQRPNTSSDITSLSRDVVVRDAVSRASAGQTRLISETIETRPQGFRKTQTFERPDGRTFTRIEDLAVTDKGSRRSLVQQNVSGTITRLEDILERQDSGTFRRTQIFTDETGETKVNIDPNAISLDPFILSGGTVFGTDARTDRPSRGSQLDLTA
jgi:hypothetical protein